MVKRKKNSLHTCEILIDLVIIYIYAKVVICSTCTFITTNLPWGKFLIPDTDNIGRILSL